MPNYVSLGRPLGGRPGGSPRTSMGWDMTHRGRHRSYQGRPRTPRGRPNCPADVHGTVDALWTQHHHPLHSSIGLPRKWYPGLLALLEIRLEHLFKHRKSGTENNARCLNVLLFNNKNDFVLKKQNIDIKLMFYLIRSIMHNKLSSANCQYGIWGSLHKDLSPQHFEPMRCQVFHFTGYYFGVWFAIYHWIVTS